MKKADTIKRKNRPSNIVAEFKMGYEEVQELVMIYSHWVQHLSSETEYDVLIGEHMKDMFYRLVLTERKMVNRATLIFNNSEARAFYDFWNTTDTSPWPLANVIICDMIKKIDKCIRVPKIMTV